MAVPNIRFINRKIPIADVARALDLQLGANGNIHCWRPDQHQHGDRTASVGIRKSNNTVKCFGCGVGPLGNVDLVMSVMGIKNPGEAARWIAQRFDVPDLAPGKHLVEPQRRIFEYGSESDIGLLVQSGLWATLSPATRAVVPVLLELSEQEPGMQTRRAEISHQTLMRFSGLASPNATIAALRELREIHWLSIVVGQREPGSGPVRATSTYLITPRSDELLELANANRKKMRDEIAIEKVMRAEARLKRREAILTK